MSGRPGRGRDGSPIRVATRGSALARRQTAAVVEALEDRRLAVEVQTVETTGDRVRDELVQNLGTTGAFVRSLDERVLDGEADVAVHSMKDVPTEMPDDLVVAAVPERAPAGDVLVTPDGDSLDDLPDGAVVGTGSLRRGAQVRAHRPDLCVEPIRGNVDTRVEKLLAPTLQAEHERRLAAAESEGADGDDVESFERTPEEWFDDLAEIEREALGREVDVEFDALVLAEAGLRRLGLEADVAFERLPMADFVPAAGQGAVAVTARDGDVAEAVFKAVNHPRTRVETTVERLVLEGVGGGCIAPIGVHAVVQGADVHVTAQVFDPDGERRVSAARDVPVDDYVAGARDVVDHLRERGAADLIAAAAEAGGEARR